MSYYFELDGDTVWNPSLRVARIYLGYVDVISGLAGLETGLAPADGDICAIELETFHGFCEGLASWAGTTRNVVFHSLVQGVLVISVAMLDRCAGDRFELRVPAEILERARSQALSMAR